MVTPEKFEADGALKVTKATTNPNPAQLWQDWLHPTH
jgi:hypothetical protein